MVRGALASGTAARRAVFEVFARHLPAGRRYGVVAGTGRLLDALESVPVRHADAGVLTSQGIVDEPTASWLSSYRFSGDIWGYGEGDLYFPGSPILVVEAGFAEAVILETLALSILNHDAAIASAASRMVHAAAGRPIIEMGSRRTHEMAGVAAARAAYLAGFISSSNLQAGRAYGVPTAGTSAHAFTLLHDSERHAFAPSSTRSAGHDAAGRHLRRGARGRRGGRAGRTRARRRTAGQRRPGGDGTRGTRAARRAWAPRRPGSS